MLAVKSAVCAIAQCEHLRDPDGDQQRLVDDLPVGEAQRGVAGGLAARVEGAIVLERAAVAVGVPAVGLDDDAVRGPDEVGLVALDRVVAARRGQLRGLERGQQRALERAAGRLGVVVRVARDQPPDERLGAGAVGVGASQLRDRLERGGDAQAVLPARLCSVGRAVDAQAGSLRGARSVSETSMNGGIEGRRPQRWAAVRWESAAPGPAARSAAIMRPRSLSASWPTA